MSYDPVPQQLADEKEHRRKLAVSINAILQGKLNAVGDVILTPSAATTAITDLRISIGSYIALMPLSANAAAALAGLWFETVNGQATLHHASNAQTDREFRYLVIG